MRSAIKVRRYRFSFSALPPLFAFLCYVSLPYLRCFFIVPQHLQRCAIILANTTTLFLCCCCPYILLLLVLPYCPLLSMCCLVFSRTPVPLRYFYAAALLYPLRYFIAIRCFLFHSVWATFILCFLCCFHSKYHTIYSMLLCFCSLVCLCCCCLCSSSLCAACTAFKHYISMRISIAQPCFQPCLCMFVCTL